jgi:hypothetical protein
MLPIWPVSIDDCAYVSAPAEDALAGAELTTFGRVIALVTLISSLSTIHLPLNSSGSQT